MDMTLLQRNVERLGFVVNAHGPLMRIAPFSEPGKLAFPWFCYGNYGNHRINKARVRYVACITL